MSTPADIIRAIVGSRAAELVSAVRVTSRDRVLLFDGDSFRAISEPAAERLGDIAAAAFRDPGAAATVRRVRDAVPVEHVRVLVVSHEHRSILFAHFPISLRQITRH